ncbi:MAG: FAD synthetase family protein [Treponema sp.]|jgi:riboflavin kinase/FMN adenylyltransferase|nr:FAD synthetase family protein [Treponema sp.]
MRILDWDTFVREGKAPSPPLALSVGVFDGVHRGHQKLIEKIRDYAAEHGGLGGVVTFVQNPRRVLRPRHYPGDIYSLPQKLRTLEGLGVDFTVLIDFSGDISTMMGGEFVALMGLGRVGYLALGANFRCGYRLDTDGRAIRDLAAPFGTLTELVPQVRQGGAPVSSSRIRQALLAGNIAGAAALLGRPFRVDLEGLRPAETGKGRCYDLSGEGRVLPPGGRYSGRICTANSGEELETLVTLDSGRLFMFPVPPNLSAVSVELCGSQ